MIVEVERSGRRPKTVVACYSVLDRVFPKCGFLDLTEGIYSGDASTSYEQAQANQQDYLLDQVCCNAGNRILDIGCGYGTLLARIGKRGAKGVGISLSPEHVRFGRSAGRDIRQL